MRTIVAVTLLSVGLAAQQREARVATLGTAEISGVVLGADGRQPIRRAVVTIAGEPLTASRSVITDDAGRFAFTRLPSGTFAISAKKAAYLDTEYGSSRPGRPGSRIAVAAGETRRIALSIFKGATISGALLQANGTPATGVNVVAVNVKLVGRELITEPVVTNDLGEYRIYGLQPGEYFVAATPGAGGSGDTGARSTADMDAVLARLATRQNSTAPADKKPAADSAAAVPPGPAVGYAPIFFPGTALLAQAQTVRLAAEEDREAVSFTIARVPVAAIKGTITGEVPNLATVQLAITTDLKNLRWGGAGSSIDITTRPANAAGEFEFQNVSPGRYQLTARGVNGSNQGVFATADVEVRGQDVTDVTLALRPGGTMSGILAFDSGGTPIPTDLSRFRVGVSIVGDRSYMQMSGLRFGSMLSQVEPVGVRNDSSFQLTGIAPGTYSIECQVPPELITTWRVRSAVIDGKDLLDTGLVGPDVSLRGVTITLSDKRTEISGTLASATGQPVADHYLIAFSTDRTTWRAGSRRIQSARPATNGRFVITDLPAGEYYLAGLTDLDPGAWQDPAFLDQVASIAVKITLAEGEKKTQDLRIR